MWVVISNSSHAEYSTLTKVRLYIYIYIHIYIFFFKKLNINFSSLLCKYLHGCAEDDFLLIGPFYGKIYIYNTM